MGTLIIGIVFAWFSIRYYKKVHEWQPDDPSWKAAEGAMKWCKRI